jgi:putative sterol carrier protein
MSERPQELIELFRDRLKKHPEATKNVNTIFQFILDGEDGGKWWVDLTKSPGEIGEGSHDAAKCTISMSAADFVAMVRKAANPMVLFMSRRLKVFGDLSMAFKLQSVVNLL